MLDDEFERLLNIAIDEIPKEFRDKIRNISITFQDWPTKEQLKKAKVTRGLLLGLYEGIPQTRGSKYQMKLPDKITIFKIPILMVSRTLDRVNQQVKSTLMHEIAHHFGMDEGQVRDAERSRHLDKMN